MTTFFVDTSAAAKRYINEQGSGWIRNNLDPSTGNVVIVSELLKPEIEGTLSRYHLGKYILTRAHVMLRNEFLRHFE
jgi:predicted nucleic acid-binding protein